MTARLITIPFSHYVEKARWALDHTGAVPYREEGHVPLLHRAATARAGGRTVPVLCLEGGRALTDSTDIVQYADARAPEGRRLYPAEPAARRECEALEDFFDTKFGADARRVGYHHLLADRRLLATLLAQDVPAWQRALVPAFAPVFVPLVRRGLRIDAAGVARSQRRIDEAFARVAERLAGGARYLVGARFTAADLTFAALAAPVVLPPEYGVALPALDAVPPAFADAVRAYRATPAGAFALRIYRDHRRAGAAS